MSCSRSVTREIDIEYHQPEPCEARTIRLPLVALEACEGRDDEPVTFVVRSGESVELDWNDRGVTHRAEQIQLQPKSESVLTWPTTLFANDAEFWPALADSVETTDPQSSSCALGCLHLRGAEGKVEATDGRQALIQSGYGLGFKDDVLVPATKLLGWADLNVTSDFRIGRDEKHVGFELGG